MRLSAPRLRRSGQTLAHRWRSTHPRQTLQVNQAPHVVGEILETYARPRPYQPDTANPCSAHVIVLRAEDRLHPCPKPRTTPVARLLPIVQRTVAITLAMNPTPQASGFHLLLDRFRPLGAVRPHTACRVVRSQQLLNHLAVVHRRVRHPVTPNQFVFTINAHVVLVPIVTLAVLLGPARIAVPRSSRGQAFLPTFGRLVRPCLG